MKLKVVVPLHSNLVKYCLLVLIVVFCSINVILNTADIIRQDIRQNRYQGSEFEQINIQRSLQESNAADEADSAFVDEDADLIPVRNPYEDLNGISGDTNPVSAHPIPQLSTATDDTEQLSDSIADHHPQPQQDDNNGGDGTNTDQALPPTPDFQAPDNSETVDAQTDGNVDVVVPQPALEDPKDLVPVDPSMEAKQGDVPNPAIDQVENNDELVVKGLTPAEIQASNDWRKIVKCRYGKSTSSSASADFPVSFWIQKYTGKRTMHDDLFRVPSALRLRRLKKALHHGDWNVRDWKRLPSLAVQAGYTVCRMDKQSQGNSVVLAWVSKYKGDMMLFTRHKARVESNYSPAPLVIEVPHPLFDRTLYQSFHVFQESDAKALMLSTSHRCSKAAASTCTGNFGEPVKTNCPRRGKYAMGDAAHAVGTTFFAAHEFLSMKPDVEGFNLRDQLVASIHSTRNQGFVVSDGTSIEAPEDSAVRLVASGLAQFTPGRNVFLCNIPRNANFSEPSTPNLFPVTFDQTYICGASNVQGRLMNGSPDPCHHNITREGHPIPPESEGIIFYPRGRFVHVEQPVELVKIRSGSSTLAHVSDTATSQKKPLKPGQSLSWSLVHAAIYKFGLGNAEYLHNLGANELRSEQLATIE